MAGTSKKDPFFSTSNQQRKKCNLSLSWKKVQYIWNLHIVHRHLFNKPNFLVKPAAINSALQNLNGKLGINQNRAGNQINKSSFSPKNHLFFGNLVKLPFREHQF